MWKASSFYDDITCYRGWQLFCSTDTYDIHMGMRVKQAQIARDANFSSQPEIVALASLSTSCNPPPGFNELITSLSNIFYKQSLSPQGIIQNQVYLHITCITRMHYIQHTWGSFGHIICPIPFSTHAKVHISYHISIERQNMIYAVALFLLTTSTIVVMALCKTGIQRNGHITVLDKAIDFLHRSNVKLKYFYRHDHKKHKLRE